MRGAPRWLRGGANHAILTAMQRALILLAVVACAQTVRGEPARWRQVSPLPTAADLGDLCHGANLYVAVARDGSVLHSRDGDHWARKALGPRPLRGVAYGNGRFVVVGDRSWREGTAVYSSPDAIHWKAEETELEVALLVITYAPSLNLFVAGGEGGALFSTPDGVKWTRRASGTGSSLTTAVAAAGVVVVAGDRGTLLSSRDGVRWQPRASGTRERIEEVVHDGSRFLAVGRRVILSSADGESWSARRTELGLQGLARSPGVYVSSERGALLHSVDGVEWDRVPVPGLGFVSRIRYLNAQFLALGEEGMILSSLDGRRWTQRSSGTGETLNALAWTGSRFLGVGEHGALVSSGDGQRWRRGPRLTGSVHAIGSGHVGKQRRLVAVGERARIWSSADEGESFQARECGDGILAPLRAVAHAAQRFIAVGDGGTLCVSGDGAGWARRKLPLTCDLVGVGGGVKQALALCRDGRTLLSRDAVSWQAGGTIVRGRSCGAPLRLRALVADEGGFLAVGAEGALFGSSDGHSWQDRSLEDARCARSGAAAPPSLVAATSAAGGRFVAVGDAIVWGTSVAGTPSLEPRGGLRAVAAGKPGFVVAGERGRILFLPAGGAR
jgi:hypothetical protein